MGTMGEKPGIKKRFYHHTGELAANQSREKLRSSIAGQRRVKPKEEGGAIGPLRNPSFRSEKKNRLTGKQRNAGAGNRISKRKTGYCFVRRCCLLNMVAETDRGAPRTEGTLKRKGAKKRSDASVGGKPSTRA